MNKNVLVDIREGEAQEKFYTFYYASGDLKAKRGFKNGLPEGNHEYFYKTGSLKTVLPYNQGRLDGEVLLFYPNGSKKREANFKQGLRNSFERLWSETGQLLIEAEYKDDKPINRASSWHKNGLLKIKVEYDDEGREQHAEEWNSLGGKIVGKTLDYFDQLISQTKMLAEVIDACYTKIESIDPSNAALFTEDLKSELALLKESNQKIQMTFSKENFPEPIWKSDVFQKQVQHQISDMIDKMITQVKAIFQAIEQMISKRKEHE